jgi:MFS family permease
MSSNYAVLGLGMAAAGVLTDVFGARAVWMAAGCIYLVGAFVALLMTRWLPVSHTEEWEAVEVSSESAVAALGYGATNGLEPEPERAPEFLPGPELAPVPVANGSQPSGLERIATLLEEIETRRELEAQRRSR